MLKRRLLYASNFGNSAVRGPTWIWRDLSTVSVDSRNSYELPGFGRTEIQHPSQALSVPGSSQPCSYV